MKNVTSPDLLHAIADFDPAEIGRTGQGRITCAIHGYWSSDPISLYIRRDWRWAPDEGSTHAWIAELSHSSGGRDKDEEWSDTRAERNFGAALIAMADLGEQILAVWGQSMETEFQRQRAAERAADEEAKRAKAAAVAEDAPLSLDGAQLVMHQIACGRILVAFERGTTGASAPSIKFTAERGRDGRLRFYDRRGALVSRSALLAHLQTLSHRTHTIA